MSKSYQMWIIVELNDFEYNKVAFEKVERTVQEMGGEVTKWGGFGDSCAVAKLPHRKYRTVERAVAAALNTIPVKRTIVASQDPYVIRKKTLTLTMELYRRQDEVVGIGSSEGVPGMTRNAQIQQLPAEQIGR